MLTLGRRRNEVLIIGDDIYLKVLSVNEGGIVTIGITAPDTIEVHREEVYNRIHGQKRSIPVTYKKSLLKAVIATDE